MRRAESRDLILPMAVIAVVAMMVFPLPPFILDVLLMCNIAFALALLASSVYLVEPEKFTSLPTVLLLATLFRLGLNVSTTRQLLGHGEAPDVVMAFGGFVVGGNLVVGIVVFAIITLVQFLVISKGAERVAEVAARFTLDAMPGKQMSIDADIRAGILSLSDAKEKRLDLHRESKLYGALDGAMKFVKGDAIAGLLITIVNIVAGLVVGVTQHGLSLPDAASKYTLFTVGDGLVSQIPALLVAVAAGIAVTRVGDRDNNFIGRDIFCQLLREPQAILASSGVLALMAFVPGLPTLPFLTMSLLFFFFARKGTKKMEKEQKTEESVEFRPKIYSGFLMRLSPNATISLQRERKLQDAIREVRTRYFETRGVVVPDVQFEVAYELGGTDVEILFNGVVLKTLSPGEAEGEVSDSVASSLDAVIDGHLTELVDDTQTRVLLEVHQAVAEDLINSVVPSLITVTALSARLRQLVAEGISIRHLNTILQAIAEYHLRLEQGEVFGAEVGLTGANSEALSGRGFSERINAVALLANVRIALGRSISRRFADDNWRIKAWMLSGSIDGLLSKLTFAGLAVDPALSEALLSALRNASSVFVENYGQELPLVVICSKYSRSLLANILLGKGLEVGVLAVEELAQEAQAEVLGELSCAADDAVANGDGASKLSVIGRAA